MVEPSWLKYSSLATAFAFNIEVEGFLAIVVGSDWLVKATAGNGLKEHPMAGFSVLSWKNLGQTKYLFLLVLLIWL